MGCTPHMQSCLGMGMFGYMSLEACPTCGYAVSTTNPRCHHCHGAPEESPRAKKFNTISPANFLLFWILSMSLIFILLNWS